MWGLLVSTLLTSSIDCLNPIAITQHFVLQGLVKKRWHIWFFILATGFTNLLSGYLAYYGILSLISEYFNMFISEFGSFIFTSELILGLGCVSMVFYFIHSTKIKKLENQVLLLSGVDLNSDENVVSKKIRSVTPFALVMLGVVATISELTSALPYFAFLAILFNYQLTFFEVSLILFIYNLIYISPSIVLYIIYVKSQDKFDKIYNSIKQKITKFSDILKPIVIGIIGIVLVFHSLGNLIK